MTTPSRYGPYIQTHTGKRFYPLDPRHEDIAIEDIAHALGNICRFTGHTRSFYSVAQHSVLVSHCVTPEYAMAALLHDASEAYIADLSKPVKSLAVLQGYEQVEHVIMVAIAKKFGFDYPLDPTIKEADNRTLFTEKRDLLSVHLDWGYELEPYPFEIEPISPAESKQVFLQRFEILTANDPPPHPHRAAAAHAWQRSPTRLFAAGAVGFLQRRVLQLPVLAGLRDNGLFRRADNRD